MPGIESAQLLTTPVTAFVAPPPAVTMAAVNQYATSEQVTSVTQLSDVQPTDWAYQALSNRRNLLRR